MADDALFCVGQKAFIEKDGKILILYDPKDGIDFPGGKIQEGEAKVGDSTSLTNALKREVMEETGLEIEVGNPFDIWYFEFRKGHRNYPKVVYIVAFKCKYISGDVTLSDEHSEYKWISRDDYMNYKEDNEYFGAVEKYFKEF